MTFNRILALLAASGVYLFNLGLGASILLKLVGIIDQPILDGEPIGWGVTAALLLVFSFVTYIESEY